MMLQSKQTHIQFFALTIFLLYWNQIPVTAKPLDQEIAFDYREGSEKGPEHWGELKQEWAACKDGRSQSPISLDESRATKMIQSSRDLIVSYKPSDAILKNEGHYIALEWEGDAGSIQIDGSDYFLKRCHWHTPSEHTINGVRYDLELHMVHQSADQNNIAVVAFLYEVGQPNPFLSRINQDISSVISTKEKKLGVIDPGEIKWDSSRFYRYMGSLTTPPCTEGVIWTVNEKIDIVSREQLDLLKEAVYDYAVANARPLQRDEGRDIKLYGPSSLLSDLNAELPHRRRLNSAAIPRE
ncbi:bifunctional monodehydroascorbate reductase and carbonic anhydrase nectarin-3-like [Pyrus ussuriensis x Pyrus communis]|uniref:Carbonic anhydrase n=1 Tax=Pyrus ussuriensis x Pyrus communis TaxID=2448454 RepID=A0A5N5HSU5_9ROSA|nr:bifunctional monodehydroascorbate reductase and carbonic anhydrase nectarin-3-like [Pyrus ussuriensis x Pyrus communis]